MAKLVTGNTIMGASGANHAPGTVPDPGATSGTTRFLREDAAWVVVGNNFADAETPSGVINGSNVTFTLAHSPSPATSLQLYFNGLLFSAVADYTLSGATITFVVAPNTGGTLVVWYRY